MPAGAAGAALAQYVGVSTWPAPCVYRVIVREHMPPAAPRLAWLLDYGRAREPGRCRYVLLEEAGGE